MQNWLTKIPGNPCNEALSWCATQPDPKTAWLACTRVDWLFWLIAHILPRQRLVMAACACARTALKYVPAGEERPRLAIETAEAWCRGEATLAKVRDAAYAADAADAAYAAARAAYAAYAARAADADAAYAIAAYAAIAAGEDAPDMCEIVRSVITWEEIENALHID